MAFDIISDVFFLYVFGYFSWVKTLKKLPTLNYVHGQLSGSFCDANCSTVFVDHDW